jgi:hypothetical protein
VSFTLRRSSFGIMPFGSILQRIRPLTPDQALALERYRQQSARVIDEVRRLSDDWLNLVQYESEAERLANVAAVHRWTLARTSARHRQELPPRLAAQIHRAIQQALVDTTRAFQLLANGHRSHTLDAICDGQSLLTDSVAAIEAARQRLDVMYESRVPEVATRGSSAS